LFVVNGVKWRNLPHDFPPWETVYTYFVDWRRRGIIRRLHELLVKKVGRLELVPLADQRRLPRPSLGSANQIKNLHRAQTICLFFSPTFLQNSTAISSWLAATRS
jgi:transposase